MTRASAVCVFLATACAALADTVPVVPGSLAEISFVAAVSKGPAVEDDPSLAELLPVSIGRPAATGADFAAVRWDFLDASGKRLRRPRISNDAVTLYSRNPRRFSFRCHVPENAAAVEVAPVVLGEGDAVSLSDLSASRVPVGEILNQNHDFSADDMSLPGWRLAGPARLVKDAEGRPCALLENGGVYGDPFPVTGGDVLSVTLKAAPPRFATKKNIPWCAVHFYDTYEDASAKTQRFARPKLTVHSRSYAESTKTYPVPPTARWCRLVVRVGCIYACEARVEKRK